MAFLAVIEPRMGVDEREPRFVVVEDQPLVEAMGRVALRAVSGGDPRAELAVWRQFLVHVRMAALTEALLRAGKLHHFFAVFQVTAIAALHLGVGTGQWEPRHSIVIEAVLTVGRNLQPAGGGVTAGAGLGSKHRISAAGVGAFMTGLAGLGRQLREVIVPIDIAFLAKALAGSFGVWHGLVKRGMAVKALNRLMLAIDDKARLSAVVKLFHRLEFDRVMAFGAVAQEAKDRALLLVIAVEVAVAALAVAF